MESIQDVIDWLTKLNNSKYFDTEEASLALKALVTENKKRSTMSKKDEKKIHRICTKSYVFLNKVIRKEIPVANDIAEHLRILRTWGFHD